jgi:hypothetical protein
MGEFASARESKSLQAHGGHVSCTPLSAHLGEEEMDTNWEHQKKAITTDQKNRADDEHLHEVDKRHLKESEKDPGFIPKPGDKPAAEKQE